MKNPDVINKITTQCQALTELSEPYQGFASAINSNLLAELKSLSAGFASNAAYAQDENRLLRIGIIGQIKRGKSSFLNSLLFNGKDVLPKAATPMTAALTKISYAEEAKALIEFYSKNEWQNIVSVANAVLTAEAAYQQQLRDFQSNKAANSSVASERPKFIEASEEQKASVELFNMMKKSNINIDQYLGQTIRLENINNHDDLINQLSNYVGANGAFTPIVKSTDLQLNIDGLKNIEVVDTPGMNDPIISRGRKTQEFIGQCDVVFFLSNTCAFLDMHDMSLLAQNIPNKGIKDIILIGSRFDEVLLDVFDNYGNIGELLEGVTGKLTKHAEENVNKVCQQQGIENDDASDVEQDSILTALQKALPPLFISSRCDDLANKPSASLTEDEQHSLALLNDMYDDFTFSKDDLAVVANFTAVNSELTRVRGNKEQILAGRFTELLAGSQKEIKQKLEQIKGDVSQKRKNLADGDIESLTKKQQAIVKRIESGKSKVANVFEQYSIRAEKALATSKQEIQQAALQAKQVDSQSGSREESYTTSHTVSDSSWYNPFSWGSTKTVRDTHYRTVNYTYANVQDSVARLEEFVVNTSQQLFETSKNAINLDLFRQGIKASVKDLLDFSDSNFDANMVLMPLNNAVERITIPAINLDLDHHISTIREQFNSSTVEGDEINNLRNEQARVVSLLLNDIALEVQGCIDNIVGKLSQEQGKFVPSLTKDLTASVEQLTQDLEQKEDALITYDKILKLVESDLASLKVS